MCCKQSRNTPRVQCSDSEEKLDRSALEKRRSRPNIRFIEYIRSFYEPVSQPFMSALPSHQPRSC